VIHYYEAWLATLVIVVWHFYGVIFRLDVYPMSRVWLTGRLTGAEMVEEHPAELESLLTAEAPPPTPLPEPAATSPPSDPRDG
jgi:hypothetical protein